ncbi:MAG: hypothetical protein FD177_1025 [Desulfovibrionaceae bacterium]|nr:MAG: hypothetical protein FD177_1025 [Desulfovibrionaceae bacterium]
MSCARCFNCRPGVLVPSCSLNLKPSMFCDEFRDLEAMANRAAGLFPTPPMASPNAGNARPAVGAPK